MIPIPNPTLCDTVQNSGTLPDALYRPIIEYIHEEKTLCQLSLATQVLRLEAQRFLYHTLVTDDLDIHKGFLKAITQDPRLASYVRRYSLMAIKTIDEELWGLLALGLQAMSRLSYLGFRDHGGEPSASKILPNCTFQLDSLSWECNSDEEFLIQFFATQPRIRKLSLSPSWGLDAPVEIPPTYLPILEHCSGGHGVLRSFLPNRRITRVQWIPDLEEPSQPDPIVLFHLNQSVKMLSFGGYFARMDLPLIATHLQSLELLELIGLHDSDLLLDQLKCMSRLKRLVISRLWGAHREVVHDHKSLVVQLFAKGENLEFVDIQRVLSRSEASVVPHGHIWSRWKRDVDTSVDISQTDVWDWH